MVAEPFTGEKAVYHYHSNSSRSSYFSNCRASDAADTTKEVIQMARIHKNDGPEDRGDYWYKWFNRAAWLVGFEASIIIALVLAIVLH